MFQVDHFDSKVKFGAVVRPCWPHPGGQWFEPWLCGKKSGARSLDFGPSQPNLPPNFTFLPHQYFYCPCLHSSFPPPVWSLLSIFCFVSVSWQKHHLPISKPIIQPNQRIYVLTRTSFMVPGRNLPASLSFSFFRSPHYRNTMVLYLQLLKLKVTVIEHICGHRASSESSRTEGSCTYWQVTDSESQVDPVCE